MAIPVNQNKNRVLKANFENSEYGMLSRLWHTFITEHVSAERLEKQIRNVKLFKYKSGSEESKRKLATMNTLVYANRQSFKTFLYLFKELLRGNKLQVNFVLTTSNKKEYGVSYDVLLQSIDFKDAHKILFKVWKKFLDSNKLNRDLQYLLKVAREGVRNRKDISPERKNNILGMSKHLQADTMTFKVFIFLCTELLNGETLQMSVVYTDAYNKKFTSGIKIVLKEPTVPKGDENDLAFGE